MRTITKVAVTAIVAIAAGAFLIRAAIAKTTSYWMVDELVRDLDGAGQQLQVLASVGPHASEIKVHGYVQVGSMETSLQQQTTHTFVLEREGKKLRVFYNGPMPDTVRDQSEIVAIGALVRAEIDPLAGRFAVRADERAWVLDATSLAAKCATKYDGGPSADSAKFR